MRIHKRLIDLKSPSEIVKQIVSFLSNNSLISKFGDSGGHLCPKYFRGQ